MLTFGIDNIDQYPGLLRDGRVALLTAPSGRSSANRSSIEVLAARCHLVALLAPEHGVRGDGAAGALLEDTVDAATGLPVYSLYAAGGTHLRPEVLDAFDILVYDIQDVGLRFYTFISSLYNVMQDCAAHGKRLVILDRPDPLGGEIVEGGLLQPAYRSFVGCYELPVRYGLTAGEFALMVQTREGLGGEVRVVPCGGWRREDFRRWGKLWPMPSLALSSFESAVLYAGTCVFEGTSLSEGRGTAAPMRIVGGPGMDGERLLREFEAKRLPGVAATPIYFRPTASKHRDALCGGLLLHVTDYETIRPVTVGVELLELFFRLYPEACRYLPPPPPETRPFISLITGCGDFLDGVDTQTILARYARESEAFRDLKRAYHLY